MGLNAKGAALRSILILTRRIWYSGALHLQKNQNLKLL